MRSGIRLMATFAMLVVSFLLLVLIVACGKPGLTTGKGFKLQQFSESQYDVAILKGGTCDEWAGYAVVTRNMSTVDIGRADDGSNRVIVTRGELAETYPLP